MDDGDTDSPAECVVDHLTRGAVDDAGACLERVETASADERKATVRALRTVAEDDPAAVTPVCSALVPFLTDEERAVRLSTAKLFVALADACPADVVPAVPALSARLADGDEFYYVRARTAEALGSVALEHPDELDRDALADLRVGLSFEEPAVREELAGALACVAIGDPGLLRHHTSALADHLDDDTDLVRYHLTTALVAVGCSFPDDVAETADALAARLGDDRAHVRGRAAEALGVVVRGAADDVAAPESRLEALASEDDAFVRERAAFALGAEEAVGDATTGPVGTAGGVRATTVQAVTAMTTPDDGVCPQCGHGPPDGAPPLCPRCGAPYGGGGPV